MTPHIQPGPEEQSESEYNWRHMVRRNKPQLRRILADFISENMTASEIARRFEGGTRNAVIGFCSRNDNLDLAKGQPRWKTGGGRPKGSVQKLTKPEKKNPVRHSKSEALLTFGPIGPGVSLMDAKDCNCRAPLWDDNAGSSDQFIYCGAVIERGKNYCATHRAIYFRRPE